MLTPSHRLKHSNASAHNANFSVRKSKTLDDLWKIGLPHLRVCEGRAQRATKPAVNALSHNNAPKRIRVLLRCRVRVRVRVSVRVRVMKARHGESNHTTNFISHVPAGALFTI